MTQATNGWEQAVINNIVNNGREIGKLGEKVDRVETKVDKIETRVESIEIELEKLDRLELEVVEIKKRLEPIDTIIGWLKLIGGGIVTIALAIIANFIYSFVG